MTEAEQIKKEKAEMNSVLRELRLNCEIAATHLEKMALQDFDREIARTALVLAIRGNIANFHIIALLLKEPGNPAPNGESL